MDTCACPVKAKHLFAIATLIVAVIGAKIVIVPPAGFSAPMRSPDAVKAAEVMTSSGPVEDQDQAQVPEGPHHDYPTIDAKVYESAIVADRTGFDSPRRTLTLLDTEAHVMRLTSAFRRNLPQAWDGDMERKITGFAERDAAFTEIYRIDAGQTADGAAIRVHVGEFAQDFCGPLTTVYTIESPEVTSFVDPTDVNQALYGGSGCTIDIPSGAQTCESRANCIRKHLQQSKVDGLLDSPQIKRLRTLHIH